jgi:pilus assembly protein CpaB
MKKYKHLLLLFVAIILSALAAYTVKKYLDYKEQELIASFDKKNSYSKILVPNMNLEIGQIISTDTVSLRPVPAEYIPDGALTADDFDQVAGMAVKTRVSKGKAILRSQLQGLRIVEKFSELLKPGERALTLKVTALDSNENMLVPGDKIDILVTASGKQSNQLFLSTVLEDVLVLATGIDTIADSISQQGYEGYGTLTIGVQTENIAKVLFAKEQGTLVYALKRNDDTTKTKYGAAFEQGNGLFGQSGISVFTAGNASSGVLIETLTVLSGNETATEKVHSNRKLVKYQPALSQ